MEDKPQFKCRTCDSSYSSQAILEHHVEICGHKSSSEANLSIHINSKHKGKVFQCHICDKKYSSYGSLFSHKKSKHENVIYNCDLCEYSDKLKGNLLRHRKSIHLEQRYSCDLCNYQTPYSNLLANHVQNVHNTGEAHFCPDCNKPILQSYLPIHRKLFHSIEQTQFDCGKCTFQSIHQSSLRRHEVKFCKGK